MKKDTLKLLFIFIPAFAIMLIDILTKHWAKSLSAPLPVIGKILSFRLVTNTGAGFGMMKGYNSLFIWIMVVIIGLIIYYYNNYPEKKYFWLGIGLIIGGAIGNLLDRIYLGYVVDFISLSFWPAFNAADSAITAGAIIIAIYLLFER